MKRLFQLSNLVNVLPYLGSFEAVARTMAHLCRDSRATLLFHWDRIKEELGHTPAKLEIATLSPENIAVL